MGATAARGDGTDRHDDGDKAPSSGPTASNRDAPPQYYHDYLGLERLLDCQNLVSAELGREAHDEMLFIIVHQVHELWFKQILFELDSVLEMFQGGAVDERNMGVAVGRLRRVIEIQKELVNTLRILETMTSLDFLDFRDMLTPASGFQSVQYRIIENRLGLRAANRLRYNEAPYLSRFSEDHQGQLESSETETSLFDAVEGWLERTPFLKFERFDFLQAYHRSVDEMLTRDEAIINENPTLTGAERQGEIEQLQRTREAFELLFDEERYEAARKAGKKRLSYRATLAALLINLYRDEPILFQPFRFLERLIDVDEHFTMWRHRHAVMVHRMIGSKIGTGGSSGVQYLARVVDEHRIFTDLFDLSTYLVPRSERPPLPDDMQRELGFYYGSQGK